MVDSFVLWTPLFLLPVVLLLVFVGCALSHSVTVFSPVVFSLSHTADIIVDRVTFAGEPIMLTGVSGAVTYAVTLNRTGAPIVTGAGMVSESDGREMDRSRASGTVAEWLIERPRAGTWRIRVTAVLTDGRRLTDLSPEVMVMRSSGADFLWHLFRDSGGTVQLRRTFRL